MREGENDGVKPRRIGLPDNLDSRAGGDNLTKKEKPEAKKRTPKINKYGFLHCDKDLAKHLGIQDRLGKNGQDVPVVIERIPEGFIVKVVAKST